MKRKKILVIDDEIDLIYFLKANLELTGKYNVITATSGEEGLRAAFENKPDAILLDIIMPEMDGYEVLRRLRKDHSETSCIPVAMITALRDAEHASIAQKFGVSGYITKPFNIEDVLRMINQCM